jgi:hypothetical protein
MSKIKKIFISLGAIIVATFTKIWGIISRAAITPLYAPPSPTTGEMVSKIAKPIILVVVFIIGLFVGLTKKITKKVKTIVVSILVILAILGYVIVNYIAANY